MNIIVYNEQQNVLMNFNTDVVDRIMGKFDVNNFIELLKPKDYDRLILDVTAINNYDNHQVFQELTKGIDAEKIILLFPENNTICTPNYLARLISYGIYNFTTNYNGVLYLLSKPNRYEDVEKIDKMSNIAETDRLEVRNQKIDQLFPDRKKLVIGFRNVTPSAGATTLIYMLLKEIIGIYGEESVVAIEVNKADFEFFYNKNMYSMKQEDLVINLQKLYKKSMILIDLNDYPDDSVCTEVIYLIEPSTIKMNKMIRTNRQIFTGLANKQLVLNKSMMSNGDVYDFQKESGTKVMYNIPPLDERKRNPIIVDFAKKIGLVTPDARGVSASATSKIFGLFRR